MDQVVLGFHGYPHDASMRVNAVSTHRNWVVFSGCKHRVTHIACI